MTAATQAPTTDPLASRSSRVMIGVVRVGVALMWIQNAAWKRPPDFGRADDNGLFFWAGQAVEHPVFPPYSAFVETLFLPGIEFFGWVILLVEAGLGAFLLIGLATRLWAVVGLAQTLAIMLSVLNAPNEWHWSYYLMFLAQLALFATAAGRSYGVDGVLRPVWLRSATPFSRMMLRLS
jgi:thiosulfate dehydrogenase [quinone] large subunit